MLAAIVRFSVRFRGVVLALALATVAYSVYQLARAGLDIFPEFSPKQVILQTESPGLASEQVEVLVTQPIEDALAGLSGLIELRSQSIQGLSVVTAIFADSSDIYRDRQLVAERVAGLERDFPAGVEPPGLVPLSSASATVRTIGVTSERLDSMALRSIVDWTVVPRLKSAAGVADVNVFGGDIRQLQIQVRPERLFKYGLSLREVTAAAREATGIRGLGFIENENQRFTLRTVGQPADAEALARVVLKHADGVNVTLGDVADVTPGAAPPIGAAAIMEEPGVVMMVIGQFGANTLTVSRNIDAALAGLKDILSEEGVTLHANLFTPADYIQTSLASIAGHLLIGGALVLVVLVIFLYNARTAFISAVAIPLSLLSAAVVMVYLGFNLNIMVLGGLAIALGEVVDDAIIDTENIFRRLRENRARASPRPVARVIFDASMEVRSSVVYATFIVALVFVPLLTLGGVAGRLFAPLGIAYILAIMASLVVAMTVTPALCYVLLGRARYDSSYPPLIRWLQPRYARLLAGTTGHPVATVATTAVLLAGALAVLPSFGGTFLPDLREGHYIVHTTSIPGTSLEESIRIGSKLSARFRAIPGVRSVSQWAGRAERGADTYASHYSEYEVDLEPMSGPDQQAVLERLRAILDDFPGVLYEANTFLIERVDETISGYSAPVVVNIYGNDLDHLDRLAHEVARVARRVDGAANVRVRAPTGTATLQIGLRPERLADYGIRPVAATRAIETAYEGRVVSQIHAGNRVYDVAVVLHPAHRRHPQDVLDLPIATASGALVPLGEIAEVRQAGGRYAILHRNAQRVQTITAEVVGRDPGSFLAALKTRVSDDVAFDANTYPEYTGAAAAQARARAQLIAHASLAGVGVLVLIYLALRRLRNVMLIVVNVPFSLAGGVVAVLVTGGWLSVGSMVGFVTLFGITVRNSIMLVSHYQHLVEVEGEAWSAATAIRGAQERLTSILVTALVTALAMLPIAVNSDNPGREIMGPLAAVIIGGLASSTILNLLVMPSLMLHYGGFAPRVASGLEADGRAPAPAGS